jgi:hypothetical protein
MCIPCDGIPVTSGQFSLQGKQFILCLTTFSLDKNCSPSVECYRLKEWYWERWEFGEEARRACYVRYCTVGRPCNRHSAMETSHLMSFCPTACYMQLFSASRTPVRSCRVLKAIVVQTPILFWVSARWGCYMFRRFGETYCLRLQSHSMQQLEQSESCW